ncbi:MAG TPA: hypothetical protein VE127_10915 [Solirubrobacteraceae bacterium]|nr:hypothetical protein [Solirubrobacteraceae bacterium]
MAKLDGTEQIKSSTRRVGSRVFGAGEHWRQFGPGAVGVEGSSS